MVSKTINWKKQIEWDIHNAKKMLPLDQPKFDMVPGNIIISSKVGVDRSTDSASGDTIVAGLIVQKSHTKLISICSIETSHSINTIKVLENNTISVTKLNNKIIIDGMIAKKLFTRFSHTKNSFVKLNGIKFTVRLIRYDVTVVKENFHYTGLRLMDLIKWPKLGLMEWLHYITPLHETISKLVWETDWYGPYVKEAIAGIQLIVGVQKRGKKKREIM